LISRTAQPKVQREQADSRRILIDPTLFKELTDCRSCSLGKIGL
jgi:hypothetical protein